MTTSIRTLTLGLASLLAAVAACDEGEAGPPIELREGQTAQFKTQSTDQTFKWKGCEPPWGPDPYRATEVPEQWAAQVDRRIAPDAGASLVESFLEGPGREECDAGCASLELAWTGEVQVDEMRTRVGTARAIGKCDDTSFAWSVEVNASSSFLCTCG
jgi:hypothetical protein